jgi:hypothetical protein
MEGGHSNISYNKVDTIIQLNLSNIHTYIVSCRAFVTFINTFKTLLITVTLITIMLIQ